MASNIREVAKKVLTESRRHWPPSKERWLWNEEVQKTVKRKREWYKKLPKCDNNEGYKQYKIAKKKAKKVNSKVRAQPLKSYMRNLELKNGRNIFIN